MIGKIWYTLLISWEKLMDWAPILQSSIAYVSCSSYYMYIYCIICSVALCAHQCQWCDNVPFVTLPEFVILSASILVSNAATQYMIHLKRLIYGIYHLFYDLRHWLMIHDILSQLWNASGSLSSDVWSLLLSTLMTSCWHYFIGFYLFIFLFGKSIVDICGQI